MRRICGQSVDWIASCIGRNWIVENKVPVWILKRDHSHCWLKTEVPNFDGKFSKTVYFPASVVTTFRIESTLLGCRDAEWNILLQNTQEKENRKTKTLETSLCLDTRDVHTCFRWACKYYRTRSFLVETWPWMFSGVQ